MGQFWDYILELTLLLDNPIGRPVNILILMLFALGIIDVLRASISLFRDRQALKNASAVLCSSGASCPETPIEAILDFLRVSIHTLVGRVITRVIQLRALGLNHQEVIQFLAVEPIQPRAKLSRYIASILILLGLLGTVLGLSIAIAKTQGVVQGRYDLTALRELAGALAETLSGMKTAFATTLAGLLTSLLLSCANYATSRFQSLVARELQDFTLSQFLPHLGISARFSHANEEFTRMLIEAQKDITRAFEEQREVLQQMTRELEAQQRIQEDMPRAFGEQREVLRQMTRELEAQQRVQRDMPRAFEEQGTVLRQMMRALEAQQMYMKETLEEQRVQRDMPRAFEEQREVLQQMMQALNVQQDVTQAFTPSLDSLQETIAEFAESLKQMSDRIAVSNPEEKTPQEQPIPKPSADQYGAFEPSDVVRRDPVECTVFAPPEAPVGGEFLVQVFVHMPEDAQDARDNAQEFDAEAKGRGRTFLGTQIERGTELEIQLTMKQLTVDETSQKLIWRGKTDSVQFGVTVPKNLKPMITLGTILVFQNAIPIGRIQFKLTIVATETAVDTRPASRGYATRFQKAFISYASEDRPEVQRRVQMLEAVGITYFQDLLDIDPGERWERKLYSQIDDSDVCFLFWSTPAKESKWVTKEWRYGIQRHGEDFIMPIVIEGPPIPEPPKELQHLNFGKKHLYFIQIKRKRWPLLNRLVERLHRAF